MPTRIGFIALTLGLELKEDTISKRTPFKTLTVPLAGARAEIVPAGKKPFVMITGTNGVAITTKPLSKKALGKAAELVASINARS